MGPDVALDFQFANKIEEVWFALTDADTLAKWMWENDFKPVVGHRFYLRAEPVEGWDGVVKGEVLEVEEPYKLVYTWDSAGERTTVSWILKKGSDGSSQLHFEQNGFSEETKAIEGALEGAREAWLGFGQRLEAVVGVDNTEFG